MDITARLTETVSRKTVSSRSSSGDPTYSSADTFAARVERNSGSGYSATGVLINFTHRMFCQTSVKLSDLIFFSEDSTSTNSTGKRPASVSALYDLDGNLSHYEVLF